MGIARLVYLSRRYGERSDIVWRRRSAAAGTQMLVVGAAACCLLTGILPAAGAAVVGPTPPKPEHCKVAQQQLAGATTPVVPPDPRFDWRAWLDEKPADWPCQPGAMFGGLMPETDIPPWVLDELRRR